MQRIASGPSYARRGSRTGLAPGAGDVLGPQLAPHLTHFVLVESAAANVCPSCHWPSAGLPGCATNFSLVGRCPTPFLEISNSSGVGFLCTAGGGHSVALYEPQDVQRIVSPCTCPSSACIKTLPQ